MTLTPLDKDAVRAAAEAAVDDRIAKIDAISAAQQKVAEAEAADAEARTAAEASIKEARAAMRATAKTVQQSKDAVTVALRSALAAGWTAQQLRDIGLTVPTSIIASPRAASSGSSKKRTVRPRIGVSTDAAPDSGAAASDAAETTVSPAKQELAHAGQGA